MSSMRNGLYSGIVRHKRLRPHTHQLAYKVFSLLLDVNKMDAITAKLHLFSYNNFNLISLHDRDHGTGKPIGPYLAKIAKSADIPVHRFMMLFYPRILGWGFNPLTVYYGLDKNDAIKLIIYEVRNTFGERETYVLPVTEIENGVIWQSCAKRFYVSPFNDVSGHYSFRLTPPDKQLSLGVALKDAEGPILNATFQAERQPLTDRTLLSALLSCGWLSFKVVAGIHFEALKLWLKGMRLKPRPPHKGHPVNQIRQQHEKQ